MRVHLVDGTYELFRCFHGAPRACADDGREVGAARGLLATLIALVGESDVTHVAIAFDSVVSPPSSSRKPSDEGLIASQVSLAADVVRALGITLWPSGRYQADEVISTAAARFAAMADVDQVVICATDLDFAQCVDGDRVVLLDRSKRRVTNEDAVRERFGVAPRQLPDVFALAGDRSDGIPAVPGFGVRTAAALVSRFGDVRSIPLDAAEWNGTVRGAPRLAAAFATRRREVLVARDLLVLRTDLPLDVTVDDLAWCGASRTLVEDVVSRVGYPEAFERITRWSPA